MYFHSILTMHFHLFSATLAAINGNQGAQFVNHEETNLGVKIIVGVHVYSVQDVRDLSNSVRAIDMKDGVVQAAQHAAGTNDLGALYDYLVNSNPIAHMIMTILS